MSTRVHTTVGFASEEGRCGRRRGPDVIGGRAVGPGPAAAACRAWRRFRR
ncbi:hypothetical protein [Streptomyces sp. NPDC003006]